MSCSFITIGSETVALLLASPNRNSPVKVTPFLPDSVQAAISKREVRQNFARTFRYTLEYSADVLDTKNMTDLQLWLLRHKGETVAVPLWNDFVEINGSFNIGATALPIVYGPPARSGALWIILSPDLSTYEIVTVDNVTGSTLTLHSPGTTLNWPAGTQIYPLLFGKLVERPQWEAGHDEWIRATIKVEDNSPFSRALTTFPGSVPVVGSNITEFATKPLLTAVPSRVRQLNHTETSILYKNLGFLRQAQQYVYAQHNARGFEFEYYCGSRTEIADFERFFADRRARVKTFMVPTWNGDLRLSQDLPDGVDAHLVKIEASRYTDPDYVTNPGAPYLALITVSASNQVLSIDPVRINTVDIAGLHADVPIALSHPKNYTIASHLLLVRFAEAKLEWNYLTDGKATVRVKVIECPDEYTDPPPDEPEPLFLYRLTEQLDTPSVSLYSNYEKTLNVGGNDWTPSPLEHGAITKSTKPGNTKVEITSWGGDFTGNPLGKLLPKTLNAKLTIEILLGDAGNLGTALETLFIGDVMDVNKVGPDWKSNCVWGGRAFKRNLLRQLVKKSDNNVMFSPHTNLDAADFKKTGVISSIAGTEIHVVSLADQENDWFSLGWLETGTAPHKEIRSILSSTLISAGHGQKIIMDRPFEYAVVTQSIDLYPGYDGSEAQWLSKFAAGDPTDFGGFPFVPDTNPEVKAMEAPQPSGGKKGGG